MKEEAKPELVNERLEQKNLSFVSHRALDKFFTFVGHGREGYELWRSKVGTFVLGNYATVGEEVRFLPVVTITTHERPKRLRGLTNVVQVDTVSCGKKNSLAGFAREAYLIASRHFDLVSDDTHFLGAVDLWKSLARLHLNYVYVWHQSDWIRDSCGKPLRYDGNNIPDDAVWGSNKPLLVLRSKSL